MTAIEQAIEREIPRLSVSLNVKETRRPAVGSIETFHLASTTGDYFLLWPFRNTSSCVFQVETTMLMREQPTPIVA